MVVLSTAVVEAAVAVAAEVAMLEGMLVSGVAASSGDEDMKPIGSEGVDGKEGAEELQDEEC